MVEDQRGQRILSQIIVAHRGRSRFSDIPDDTVLGEVRPKGSEALIRASRNIIFIFQMTGGGSLHDYACRRKKAAQKEDDDSDDCPPRLIPG
jgi:hypothetical protein